MSTGATIIAIVLIVMVARVLRARYESRRFTPDPQIDRDVLRLREEVSTLHQRIAVLECIATENNRGLDLDRQIEALRLRQD